MDRHVHMQTVLHNNTTHNYNTALVLESQHYTPCSVLSTVMQQKFLQALQEQGIDKTL